MNNSYKGMVSNTDPGHIWFPNSFCGVCGEIVSRETREHCGELTIVHCGELHPLFNLDGKYIGFRQGSHDDKIYIVKNGEATAITEGCVCNNTINYEKIIDIDQGKNIDINICDIRQSIVKLACDMEDTILNDKGFCLNKSSSIEEIKEEFIQQMSEAYDFIQLPAKDLFLDQCLLLLAIRLVELRSQIWDFKTLPSCQFLRKDRKCRCFAGDCKHEGIPGKEDSITCDIYEKEIRKLNKTE